MPIYSQRNSINFKLKLLHFLDLAILKNVKSVQLFENINLEEITIVLPIIELEIGLFLKLKSKTFEQYIKEK